MSELYLAEVRRFARWGAGVGMLHLVALLMLDRLFPGLAGSAEISMLAAAAYGIAGLGFGFYGAATYGRMNHWIALLHRPVAPWRIMAGVTGAGATVAALVILVPLLGLVASHLLQPGRVVDGRHWLLALAGALIGVGGYFAGSYAALAPRRYGWTGLATAAMLMIGMLASGAAALMLPLILIALLILLVVGAFRPDRALAPGQPALLALTAGFAALTLYFLLLFGGGFAYHMTLAALGRNPLINTPPPGGLVEMSRSKGEKLIDSALAAAPGTETADIRARLRGIEAVRLPIARDSLPMRGELTNSGADVFEDARHGVVWMYSHDTNALTGLRLKDRRTAGELRPAGGFDAPPLGIGGGRAIAGGSLYRLNGDSGMLDTLLRLPKGEVIVTAPVPVGASVAVLSDRALRLFDKASLDEGIAPRVRMIAPLPGAIADLRRLDIARLPDRTIVSMFFGRNSIEGPSQAWQRVVSVADDGNVRTLAQRDFAADFPDALRYRSYWVSPALGVTAAAAARIGAHDAPIVRQAPVVVPSRIWIAAAVVALAAAIGALILARRRRLSGPAIAAWTLATLAFGLPMFLAFALIARKSPA